jgi:ribosomal protein S18 acetylase RimI-like enzyme
MHDATLRLATPGDAGLLSAFGWEAFLDTFVTEYQLPYSAADLEDFFAHAYAPSVLARLLATPGACAWVAESGGQTVGYALVGNNALPHPEGRPTDGEIQRIYVARSTFGGGLGARLLTAAMGWLERGGPRPIWLGVWSGNLRARRFYARHGFTHVGAYDFRVGSTVDHEFILRRG